MVDAKPAKPKSDVVDAPDWVEIEKEYRAGFMPLREIAKKQGITEGAIRKRAARDSWTRSLQARIQAKAEEKVRKAQVRNIGTQLTPATEKQVVEANAERVAEVDLKHRSGLEFAMNTTMGMLEELSALSDPQFKDKLIKLGQDNDQTYVTETGREVKDRENELYQYIISFSGRVKALKELSAVAAVMVPLQRKILKLDNEADDGQVEVDALLARINASVS